MQRIRNTAPPSLDNGTVGQPDAIGGRRINGVKGSIPEGGARVPLVANWKGVAPAGRVLKDSVDFSNMADVCRGRRGDPAGGKTISAEEGAAVKNRAKKKTEPQKQGQNQGQKQSWKKAKAAES